VNPVELSVVIVTYRCLPFTELCLQSLLWQKDERLEVIIVDNNSNDGSTEILKNRHPEITVISNLKNVGFGSACNQGIKIAQGRYLLMLNPDTVVPENLTQRVLDFMKENPECGAMGVQMVDGGGKFLPESKRGIPTISRAFYKFVGLSNLFPRSSVFSGYYLGHLPYNEPNEIEILSGAFMVLDSKVIAQTKGFDEVFFMYGEDIDLSYRILKSGHKVLYNPDITILHFKGESTTRNFQYIKFFYGAMDLFYRRHFQNKNRKFRFFLVKSSIYIFGAIAGIKNSITQLAGKFRNKVRFDGDWVWVTTNSNGEVKTDSNEPALNFTGKNQGRKTMEEIQTLPSGKTHCILSLSDISPSVALNNLLVLSKNRYKCIWKDANNQWLFIGWSASSRTIVKPFKRLL
jgi:GT2 family glycosyltransferase